MEHLSIHKKCINPYPFSGLRLIHKIIHRTFRNAISKLNAEERDIMELLYFHDKAVRSVTFTITTTFSLALEGFIASISYVFQATFILFIIFVPFFKLKKGNITIYC